MAAPGLWTPADSYRGSVLRGDTPVGSGYAICLVGAGGNVTHALSNYSALTGELATGGGYTTGGVPVTLVADGATSLEYISPPTRHGW